MKRYILFSLCVVIAFCICSCASNESEQLQVAPLGIKIQEVASAASENDGGVHTSMSYQWREKMIGAPEGRDIPKQMTITIDGKTYTGDYLHSMSYTYDTYYLDRYRVDKYLFMVDARDGSLEQFSAPTPDEECAETISDEERQAKALEIAQQYIDVDKYEMSTFSNDFDCGLRFKMKICGYDTSAGLTVGIDIEGNCTSFSRMMTDEFEDRITKVDEAEWATTISELDSQTTHDAIEARLKSIYAEMTEYDVLNKTVVITPDDEVGMVYDVVAYFDYAKTEDESPRSGGCRTAILVTLDQE